MSQMVRNISQLELLGNAILPGESKEFTLPNTVSNADARILGLKLARLRAGATFKVTKTGTRTLRIEATTPKNGFVVNNAQPTDHDYLNRHFRTRPSV